MACPLQQFNVDGAKNRGCIYYDEMLAVSF